MERKYFHMFLIISNNKLKQHQLKLLNKIHSVMWHIWVRDELKFQCLHFSIHCRSTTTLNLLTKHKQKIHIFTNRGMIPFWPSVILYVDTYKNLLFPVGSLSIFFPAHRFFIEPLHHCFGVQEYEVILGLFLGLLFWWFHFTGIIVCCLIIFLLQVKLQICAVQILMFWGIIL